MSQQKTQTRIPNAHQIARNIDVNNNGFTSLAQAFIDQISGLNLNDGAATHLYRNVLSIKHPDQGSSWLLAG